MRVKFCGITNKEDADHAVHLGVDAIGFIFYEKSPRYVSPEVVQEIVYFLPPFISAVGVFVNHSEADVKNIMQQCHLDFAQLHGDESPELCRSIGLRCIKALRVSDRADIEKIGVYQGNVSGILLDTKSGSQYGGTGKIFDWGLAVEAKSYGVPLILSGGISIENIKKATTLVQPDAIDLASSIEAEPGKKDYQKMTDFMQVLSKL